MQKKGRHKYFFFVMQLSIVLYICAQTRVYRQIIYNKTLLSVTEKEKKVIYYVSRQGTYLSKVKGKENEYFLT